MPDPKVPISKRPLDDVKFAKSRGSGLDGTRVRGRSILIATDHHERVWPALREVSHVMSVMKTL